MIFSFSSPVNSVSGDGPGGATPAEPWALLAFNAQGQLLGACDAYWYYNGPPGPSCSVPIGNGMFDMTVNAPGILYAEIGQDDLIWNDTQGINVAGLDPPAPSVPEPGGTLILLGLAIVLVILWLRRWRT